MTKEQQKKPDAPKAPLTPEAEANARINVLQERLKELDRELKILQGRLSNADPVIAQTIEKENQELLARLEKLSKVYFALIQDGFSARLTDDQKTQYEVLRQAAVDYFKLANIAQDLWKNLAS